MWFYVSPTDLVFHSSLPIFEEDRDTINIKYFSKYDGNQLKLVTSTMLTRYSFTWPSDLVSHCKPVTKDTENHRDKHSEHAQMVKGSHIHN